MNLGTYREGSIWNDELELECLIILKKIANNPKEKGRLIENLIRKWGLTSNKKGSIEAKIGNFKWLTGSMVSENHVSKNSRRIFNKYYKYDLHYLEQMV